MNDLPQKPIRLSALPGEATSEPNIGIKQGRGRLGGSTCTCYFGERAILAGRKVMLADGDVRNPMVSLIYPPESEHGAPRPVSDQSADGMAWITSTVNLAAQRRSSLLIDLGGGDRVLQDWSSDVNFEDLASALGLSVTGLFFCGPDIDDFTHIVSIIEAEYFRPKHSILLLNEGLVPNGRSTNGAFVHILRDRRLEAMLERGMIPVVVPRLNCMPKLKASGLSFADAIENMPTPSGERFGMSEAFFVKSWVNRFEERLEDAGVTSWLP